MATPFDPNKIEVYNPNTGTIGYSNNSSPVNPVGRLINLVDKDGNAAGSIEESEIPKALKQGYHVETTQEKKLNDYLDENKGLAGDLKAGAYSAANELSFGSLDPAMKGLASEETIARIKGLQRTHQLASGIGTGAGLLGSFAVGGPLLKGAATAGRLAEGAVLGTRAAEAGLGLKSLASAARLGTEGAILAAPQALSEATFGDPSEAAEHLLFGLGAGAALGAVAPVIKGSGKTIINGLGKPFGYQMTDAGLAGDLRNMSENQAVRALFNSSNKQLMGEINQLEKEGIKVGREIIDNKLLPSINEDIHSVAARTKAYQEATGQEISKVVDLVRDAKVINRENLVTKLDDILEKKYGNSASFTSEYNSGKKYLNDLDSQLKKFDGSDALEQTYQDEINRLATLSDPVQREAQTKVINGLRDQLLLENKNITVGKLWKESSELGNKAFKSGKARLGDPDEISELLNDFRREIRDVVKTEGSKLAKDQGVPNWLEQFNTANQKYRAASVINKVAENSANSASNRNFSLTDNIWGSAIAGGNIASAISNPLGVLAGVGGGIGSKFLRENGNTILSKYGNNIALFLNDMAQKEATAQLGRIPKKLKTLTSNAASSAGVQESGNAIARFLGTKNSDPVKSYQDLASRLQAANADNEYAKTLDNGTPGIAAAYRQVNNNVVSYLNNNIPKNPNEGQPYATKWQPSKSQIKDLNDKIAVISNPYVVLDKLQNGTLNKNHMDALKSIYPKVYNKVVQQVHDYGMTNAKMPYAKKIRLSLLTGSALDPSIKNIPQYQAIYQPEQSNSKPVGNNKLQDLPDVKLTNNQRIIEGTKA